ncbi:MAG TPA: HD domain-containing protein [Methylomusa anaerophila]|uniref:Cyclic di-GMP phosphodiesterase response regulator RpfG n=1 Tax=Methylomusa anaerophila TaxID=1930071 RepID=A0A348AFT9_9FIRM|nr:HD domain-containing phosphohydrolase [Methylomusa anaerophila]BBB89937.1 cyclic di-GMP phosphodiesterase response regulator RpfG [Methylomusa anaerophila]HML88336.1 HD domain-containing protein [Methylomusa anaerophila]
MGAKWVNVREISPGQVLGDSVCANMGKVLLSKGACLTTRSIQLLQNWGVIQVLIENYSDDASNAGDTGDTGIVENIVQTIDADKAKAFLEIDKKIDQLLINVDSVFDSVPKYRTIPLKPLQEISHSIFSELLEKNGLAERVITRNFDEDDDFKVHAVVVASLTAIISREMGFNHEQIIQATLAGLIHDIGRLIPSPTGRTSQSEHIENAAILLKKTIGIPKEIVLGVLQHHEKMDGTGIPMGYSAERIHPYARIIAVADFFHNLTCRTRKIDSFYTLDILRDEMFSSLDPEITQIFIRKVRDALMNTGVVLNDGRRALVTYFHSNDSRFPIVRTLAGEVVDLGKSPNIRIERFDNG